MATPESALRILKESFEETKSGCPWCKDAGFDDPCCTAKLGKYGCTRAPGHDGHHVACGAFGADHPLAWWKDGDASPVSSSPNTPLPEEKTDEADAE